jgi:protein phosphatase
MAFAQGEQPMSHTGIESQVQTVLPRDLDTRLGPEHQALKVRSAGLTDRGKVRPANEDQFLIAVLTKALQIQQTSLPRSQVQCANEQGHLFVVADGMGGHAGGEEASALAVDSLETFLLNTFQWFRHLKGREGDQVLYEFRQALGQADANILAEAAHRPELRGMGTTLTMAYSLNNELFIAHAGDSRCYLFRRDNLHQLTQDHTIVQEMVRRGVLPADQAARHPLRHVVTNVIGGNEAGVQVEMHKVHLEPRDLVLLCSDGLSEMVGDQEIAGLLQDCSDPADTCTRLVTAANERGGKDNVTVIVVQYEALQE